MKISVKQLKKLIREQVAEISSSRMNPRTGQPFPDRMSDDEVEFHLAQQERTRIQREKDPSFCDGHGTHEFRGRPGEQTCQICGSAAPDNIKEQGHDPDKPEHTCDYCDAPATHSAADPCASELWDDHKDAHFCCDDPGCVRKFDDALYQSSMDI